MSKQSDKDRPLSRRTDPCMLFWLFVAGSVIGFILEGIWCVIRGVGWENHSALVWGPFCVIYGIGAVGVYLLADFIGGKNIFLQGVVYMAAGALLEYVSSLFQELCFGSFSWNYSEHFLNLGGRISLQMAVIWGLLGIAFVKLLYRPLKKLFSHDLSRWIKLGTTACVVYMVVNMLVSSAAVLQWQQRQMGETSEQPLACYLDRHYNDERMERLYPNMHFMVNSDR